MAIKKNIGGDRLGSGAKMNVDLKTYNRSTHDLSYIWRSTMAAGTLVPFMKELALPGDTFDIDLDIDVKTHPTIGPLFGSYKVQLDIFQAPVRLYQSGLHNNAIGIGLRMQDILLPQMRTYVPEAGFEASQLNNSLIEQLAFNPSSLLAHLDIVGANIRLSEADGQRLFNALPYLAYWDIYKNYYANKQEEIGMFIDAVQEASPITEFKVWYDVSGTPTDADIPIDPATTASSIPITDVTSLNITFSRPIQDADIDKITVGVDIGGTVPFQFELRTMWQNFIITANGYVLQCTGLNGAWQAANLVQNYAWLTTPENSGIQITEFPLENIDEMREAILAKGKYEQFLLTGSDISPYGESLAPIDTEGVGYAKSAFSQQGLGLKTYQADLFNNWMNSEWVDNATTGINAITAVDTSDGNFTIDALNLASKVYDMLNRIAISGGTYDDWLETVYTHEYINRAESPIYHGGLSRELAFQEVISMSESDTGQPLGTLAGKGVMTNKNKGGKVRIKVDEPSYIIGIVSLTPRIDYSQGNKWDVNLKTMDDFHKPALDEIGFQDLITDQMAWWTTTTDTAGVNTTKSAGKQPAWINYMTNVNKVRGNFALRDNEMFMTLNRRYEYTGLFDVPNIGDLTTYIDPSKFNFIFAETELTSQNFWVQIGADITARRKMSAKIMPNL